MPPASRLALALLWLLLSGEALWAQEPPGPQPIGSERLQSAIDRLGELDYQVRTNASRTIRRTPGAQAVSALLQAAAAHSDGYVRYRSLVLLTGFNDPRTLDAIRKSLKSANDRLRGAAYGFLEHNPDKRLTNQLLAALDSEHSEFVRPALIRALAALGDAEAVRRALVAEVGRGEDYFRSAVVEALGDYKAGYAFDVLNGVAQLEGPLVDDAALALGKLADRRALGTLGGLLQTGPKDARLSAAAGLCLLGVDCEAHERYLAETLRFADENPGFQEMLRRAASALAVLGVAGRMSAIDALLDLGMSSRESTRAPVSLAVATVALRNTPLLLSCLGRRSQLSDVVSLLSEGFERLEEDLEKERFFAFVRRTYWTSPDGSRERELMQMLIGQLDF